MHSVSVQGDNNHVVVPRQDTASQPIFIAEDSALFKIISCIPLLGIIPSMLMELSLAEKITKTDDAEHLIRLITIKNSYKEAQVVRNLITMALMVAAFATGILGPLGLILAAVHAGLAGTKAHRINQNKEVISHLKRNGFQSGFVVV
jgi:hypothetical protein